MHRASHTAAVHGTSRVHLAARVSPRDPSSRTQSSNWNMEVGFRAPVCRRLPAMSTADEHRSGSPQEKGAPARPGLAPGNGDSLRPRIAVPAAARAWTERNAGSGRVGGGFIPLGEIDRTPREGGRRQELPATGGRNRPRQTGHARPWRAIVRVPASPDTCWEMRHTPGCATLTEWQSGSPAAALESRLCGTGQ